MNNFERTIAKLVTILTFFAFLDLKTLAYSSPILSLLSSIVKPDNSLALSANMKLQQDKAWFPRP